MKYEEMSDFEINKAVLLIEDVAGDIESITCRETKLKCINSVAMVKFKDIDDLAKYNPCNNPSDAWPIIVENKISILPSSQGDWLTYGWKKWYGEQDPTPRKEAVDKNPLRAAMICFLKMKDAQQ